MDFTEKADREGGKPIDIVVRDLNINGFISNQDLGSSQFFAPCVFFTSFSLPSKKTNSNRQDSGALLSGENNAVRNLNLLCKWATFVTLLQYLNLYLSTIWYYHYYVSSLVVSGCPKHISEKSDANIYVYSCWSG